MNGALRTSAIRTLVPIIYALLLKTGFAAWLGFDNQWLANLAAAVAAGLVYLGLRLAERYAPQLGWLLGYPSQPSYGLVPPNPPEQPNAEPEEVRDPGRHRSDPGI